MLKKVSSMILAAFLALSLSTSAHAAETSTISKEESGVKVLGEYNGKQVVSVKKIVNGQWEDVAFEDFLKDMSTKKPAKGIQQPEYSNPLSTPPKTITTTDYTWYSYIENSGYYYNPTPRKASPDYGCPSSTTAPCSLALQYSLTQSKSANVSLALPEWNAVKATLGYTYQETASVSATYTLPVPPGKYGHIEFAPKYYHSEGTMQVWSSGAYGAILISNRYIGLETPQKLSTGMLDGYALGVITNTPT